MDLMTRRQNGNKLRLVLGVLRTWGKERKGKGHDHLFFLTIHDWAGGRFFLLLFFSKPSIALFGTLLDIQLPFLLYTRRVKL